MPSNGPSFQKECTTNVQNTFTKYFRLRNLKFIGVSISYSASVLLCMLKLLFHVIT